MLPHYSPTGSDSASASQRCPPDTRTLVRGRQRKRAIRESPLQFIQLNISTNYNLYDKNDNGGSKPPPYRYSIPNYEFIITNYIISPPPRTVSSSNITSDCPFVIARCGSSNFTCKFPFSSCQAKAGCSLCL